MISFVSYFLAIWISIRHRNQYNYSMSENKDKIQNYIRWTRFNNGHISELQDSYIIIDFFNDLLCDKDIILDDRKVDH